MDFDEEIWLPVKDYEGFYEVSSLGRVRGLKSDKILSGYVKKDGYLQVGLYKDNTRKMVLVHRIVLQTFNPTEEDLVCDHRNQIKNDNRLVNLRWATSSQNNRHKLKKEGTTSRFIGVCKDGNHWQTKCSLDGERIYIGYFANEEEAAEAYNEFVIKHNLQDFNILNQIN